MGFYATANGYSSTAMGDHTVASGNQSTAVGYRTVANAQSSFAVGRYNIGGGHPSNWILTDPIFEIGIGNSITRANAMTVLKNGNVGIGTTTPVATLDINGTAKLKKYAVEPNACDATYDGQLALTSVNTTCVCNGTSWVKTSDGATACAWF